MKFLLKRIYSLINKILLKIKSGDLYFYKSTIYRVRCKVSTNNNVELKKCVIEKSSISVEGEGNELSFNESFIEKCRIKFAGNNNKLIVENDVQLRNVHMLVRGENCTIKICEGTTFGGARLVNVGTDNDIHIGKNCLFADNIEIWASDTHSIFDNSGEIINKEKPISIGNRVWVGSHVIILKGVNIENDSIIGMGTKVTRDVPAHTINVGSPNKTIKEGVTWDIEY